MLIILEAFGSKKSVATLDPSNKKSLTHLSDKKPSIERRRFALAVFIRNKRCRKGSGMRKQGRKNVLMQEGEYALVRFSRRVRETFRGSP